jgi:hypothetical protein
MLVKLHRGACLITAAIHAIHDPAAAAFRDRR